MFIAPHSVLLEPTALVMWPINPIFINFGLFWIEKYWSLLSVLSVLCTAPHMVIICLSALSQCGPNLLSMILGTWRLVHSVRFKTVLYLCSNFSYRKLSRRHRVTMVTIAMSLAKHCTQLPDTTSQLMCLQHPNCPRATQPTINLRPFCC